MDIPSSDLLIYLFADAFIEPPGGVLNQSALAPRTGDKIDLKTLVLRCYAAAFMDLVNAARFRLTPVEARKFLGKETALMVSLHSGTGAPDAYLGSLLVDRLLSIPTSMDARVRELVTLLTGGKGSTKTPWLDALAPILKDALRCGYVTLPEKQPGIFTRLTNPAETRTRVVPALARIDPLRSYAVEANGRLDQFLVYQGDMGGLLLKEIEAGINACQDRADFD